MFFLTNLCLHLILTSQTTPQYTRLIFFDDTTVSIEINNKIKIKTAYIYQWNENHLLQKDNNEKFIIS